MYVNLYTDGGVRTGKVGRSSGRAAIGCVIRDAEGEILVRNKLFIGEATVNEAEYSGIIRGLHLCLHHEYKEVCVFSDSQLVINQIMGVYRVKDANLREYHDEVIELTKEFDFITFTWIPREENQLADMLTREVLGN